MRMNGTLGTAREALAVRGIAATVRGDEHTAFSSVSIDTRTMAPRALYVALRGERYDGHDFVAVAEQRGAVALLTHSPQPAGLPQLVVADTRRALGELAAHWRAQFALPLVAVAGSNGKTTTTQMIAAIFAQAYGERDGRAAWFATRGNRNNDIGVPLMLMELDAHHRAAVLELGMNHPGEIAVLAGWARPDVALLTNAQREHQEFLDSVEATARENGAAIAALGAAGIAVFPADDACAGIWRALAGGRKRIEFALDDPTAAVSVAARAGARSSQIRLRTPSGTATASLAVGGAHSLRNALAAAAACAAIGIPGEAIVAGLSAFRPVAGRGTRTTLATGAELIDDSYNANPDSVRAAIDLLAGHEGCRLLVLGDMGEVGPRVEDFHREVGAYARDRGIDELLALGTQARLAVQAFGRTARHFENVDEIVAAARSRLDSRGTVPLTILVKGSRFMRMERIAQALASGTGGTTPGDSKAQHA
jgi:UDP-N-acetylmuramoyl-tripeptide--D-alanyl-D-alanine ligase